MAIFQQEKARAKNSYQTKLNRIKRDKMSEELLNGSAFDDAFDEYLKSHGLI